MSDEAVLVSHARGDSCTEKDVAQAGGIIRKVEVTHTVTYTTDFDGERNSKRC